ncbi:MAG TPA: aminopeptidase N [Alphaproteobacteria bacterium]|nr:aminopeptidase N [Alphaproteobacteria bacterium]
MQEQTETPPQPIFARDYRAPDYRITHAYLEVSLDPHATRILARLDIEARDPGGTDLPPLILDGEKLKLEAVRMDGAPLRDSAYSVDAKHLTLHKPPARFQLETETIIDPGANTELEGLYLAGRLFCTQCEPEGFRRIAYFIDRPDNLTIFRTRIIGDKASCPILLSNGNMTGSGELPDGRHWAEWHDPFPKPSYLFALVAGNLALVRDSFTTQSGREIDLRIYVDPGMEDRSAYAMDALKRAMRWDETRFGLEYDLDIYMIVATIHFNMGAMENKGLNVFNSKFVLARADTATDADFAGIERVIAHEYFHNWTGNRVTCRDWFQLSLKEGLTVFRDQEFCADMRGAAVARIEDVRALRARQFAEDAGPLAHPVRPDSYIEINNFYTATVYEKGAELVRMLQTLLGRDAFTKGVQLYLRQQDGAAATIEDFVRAMQQASGKNLDQFYAWYAQAGTPEISVEDHYDPATRNYSLTLTQRMPGRPECPPLPIPIAYGLLDQTGAGIAGANGVLELTGAQQSFQFRGLASRPTPSLFREFSAPVTVNYAAGAQSQAFLLAHDSDPFNRWEAGQQYALRLLADNAARLAGGGQVVAAPDYIEALAALLRDAGRDKTLDKAFVAAVLTLPSEQEIARRMPVINVTAVHGARQALRCEIAAALRGPLLEIYQSNDANTPYSPDAAEAGRRSLRNCALAYLALGGMTDLAMAHYRNAGNMTDSMAALSVLAHLDIPERTRALDDFYGRWRGDALVLDKWFTAQALSFLPDTLTQVQALLAHPDFSFENPNRVRALIGAFCHSNQLRFNAADGSGYRFFADQVLALDKINAQVASRLLTAMDQWRRFDAPAQAHAREALTRIVSSPGLSPNVYEIAIKTLGSDGK